MKGHPHNILFRKSTAFSCIGQINQGSWIKNYYFRMQDKKKQPFIFSLINHRDKLHLKYGFRCTIIQVTEFFFSNNHSGNGTETLYNSVLESSFINKIGYPSTLNSTIYLNHTRCQLLPTAKVHWNICNLKESINENAFQGLGTGWLLRIPIPWWTQVTVFTKQSLPAARSCSTRQALIQLTIQNDL